MEWTDMRESFLCGAFAQPAIRSGKAAGIFSEWDLYCQCGPVTFLEGQHAHVRLRYRTWTDRLAESLGATVLRENV